MVERKLEESNEEIKKMAKEETVTMSKSTLYHGVIGVLVILIIASVFTSGFGIVKPTGVAPPTIPTQPNAPAIQQPSTAPAPSGTSGNIKSLMDTDMKLGSDSAPLVMIEFSDFQCPFCRKFWIESLPSIQKEYIDTGKVQLVYRDFPLSFHPSAQKAAEATECAKEQGKGWELHDKIFEEENKLGQGTVQFTVDNMKSWAAQISGLDTTAFTSCLDSGKYAQEVQKDFNDGSAAGIQGTPGFFVGKRDGNTVVPITGAQPYSAFKSAFDQLLQ